MSFTFIKLFGCLVAGISLILFVLFILRDLLVFHDGASNYWRMAVASLVSGVVVGLGMSIMIAYLLPTYITVTEGNVHQDVYVLNDQFWKEHGRRYVDNQTDSILYLMAMYYGSDKPNEKEQPVMVLPARKLTEIKHDPDGYFETPPRSVRTKSNGATKWYLEDRETAIEIVNNDSKEDWTY